jgi:Tol biopolymer transport system component
MRQSYLLSAFLLLLGVADVQAQNYPSMEQFGKNRIQQRTFTWKTVKTANFEVYFYQDGGQLANLTAQYAESEFDRITELLGYTPYNRVKIFLFNSPAELAQSNIGLNATGGLSNRELDLSKSRLEIAFTGDQMSFRRQLIRDVSMLFVYDMLYGGSLKDALQSSLLLTLPDWFMPGIAAYIAEGWSVELDDYMRDVSLNRPVRKPSLLNGPEAERVGQSIWNFIVQKHGRDNISNILNLTRIIRNEQSSISSTLGVSYNRFLRDWREYYTTMAEPIGKFYKPGTDNFRISLASAEGARYLNDLKISPDKQFFAYSTVQDGKFEVQVVNTTTRRKTPILQGGYRLDGHASRTETPLLAWQRNGNLIVITDERGKTYLYIYTNVGKRPKLLSQQIINGLTQVISVDASDDGGSLILSADRRGQNDLFLYSLNRGNYAQLTNDLYDDLNPQFVGRNASQFVFSSNRILDTLGTDKGTYRTVRDRTSLFKHEGGARATSVTRLTDSLLTATQPIPMGENTVYFLSSTSGIRNLYRLNLTDSTTRPVTAFSNSIQHYDLIPANGGFVYSGLQDGELYIGYRAQLNLNATPDVPPTTRVTALNLLPIAKPAAQQTAVSKPGMTTETTTDSTKLANPTPNRLALEPGEVDTDNYQFDPELLRSSDFKQRRPGSTALPLTTGVGGLPPRNRRREAITIRGPFDYRGLFVVSGGESSFRVDPIRGFGYTQTVQMNDLLENHIVKAGLFITTNLKNSDVFAEYQNLTHRVDFGVRFDRQTLFIDNNYLLQRYRYNRLAFSASYPISVTTRFTVSPFYALARQLDLSGSAEPDLASDYGGLRGEFVYDNTKTMGLNMLKGTRFKVKFDEFAGLRSKADGFYRLTVDIRHYQYIHRDVTLAVRLSYGQSGGAAPKQSTLGGMENWIGGQPEPSTANQPNPLILQPLDFQTARQDYRNLFFLDFVSNLRGFRQGKLTGTSHLLLNAELRVPLVKYFYRGNIASNFLRNLQFVAFTDVGTAWTGRGPFNRQNSLNTETYGGNNTPFTAIVTNFKNPFLVGYGAGVRTMLLGYYVKFDYAWGLEDNVIDNPRAYLTLGYDF